VSQLADLYVVVGHDANITQLKSHAPMFDQRIRCYVVNAIRFVKLAVVSSGTGWMDAEPEVSRIKPHIYAVNEDGDRPEKREFCERTGIEYRVLKRTPKPGLPRRESSQLRGF
jgi:glycerol-3-phosphate cytidylyltransferase-like family protein